MSLNNYGRLYPYVIPGYTGHIPHQEEPEGGEYIQGAESQIPGYVGYIPHLKPENMFGKTYGKITSIAKNETMPIGNFIGSDIRYKSSMKEAYINQLELWRTQNDLTNFPHSMQLTKKLNDVANAGFPKDYDAIHDNKKTGISLTAEQIRAIAHPKKKEEKKPEEQQ